MDDATIATREGLRSAPLHFRKGGLLVVYLGPGLYSVTHERSGLALARAPFADEAVELLGRLLVLANWRCSAPDLEKTEGLMAACRQVVVEVRARWQTPSHRE